MNLKATKAEDKALEVDKLVLDVENAKQAFKEQSNALEGLKVEFEESFKEEANQIDVTEVVEVDLVIPKVTEEWPGINEYRSNDGLNTDDCTLKLPEVLS